MKSSEQMWNEENGIKHVEHVEQEKKKREETELPPWEKEENSSLVASAVGWQLSSMGAGKDAVFLCML